MDLIRDLPTEDKEEIDRIAKQASAESSIRSAVTQAFLAGRRSAYREFRAARETVLELDKRNASKALAESFMGDPKKGG